MNTLELMNNVLSSFGREKLNVVEEEQNKEVKKKSKVYNIIIEDKEVVDLAVENKEEPIENKSIKEKSKNVKVTAKTAKTTKKQRATKKNK